MGEEKSGEGGDSMRKKSASGIKRWKRMRRMRTSRRWCWWNGVGDGEEGGPMRGLGGSAGVGED